MGQAAATLVIAQYGQGERTRACVDSFRAHHATDVPIIVVDDGSAPADLQPLEHLPAESCRIIRQAHAGVTAAWRAGAALADSRTLVFLNNDVLTSAPWLDALLAPLLRGTVVVSGVQTRQERRLPERILARLPTRRFAAGWCFAVPRAAYESCGGLEPSLTLYFSDTDLQARLLQQSACGVQGLAIVSCDGLVHAGHATTVRCRDRRDLWRADRRQFITLWRESRGGRALLTPDTATQREEI